MTNELLVKVLKNGMWCEWKITAITHPGYKKLNK